MPILATTKATCDMNAAANRLHYLEKRVGSSTSVRNRARMLKARAKLRRAYKKTLTSLELDILLFSKKVADLDNLAKGLGAYVSVQADATQAKEPAS